MKSLLTLGGSLLFLLFSFCVLVSLGSVEIPIWLVWKVIVSNVFFYNEVLPSDVQSIIWELRLPRILMAGIVGAMLSLAGVIFQGLLKNHLADPYILGVSSGSAAGAVLAIIVGLSQQWISMLAFVGALLALILVLLLATDRNQLQVNRLILSGVIIQSFFGAMVTFLLSTSYPKMQTIVYWLLGGFTLKEWNEVWLGFSFLWIGLFIGFLFSRQLNIISFGDKTAIHLGISVTVLRLLLLITASLITAIAVSLSGTIGFVGLVIPHITRLCIGNDHRLLLPLATILGAIFLMWADGLAQWLISPQELPLGVITAMIGAPFFAFLLKTKKTYG